MNKIILGVISAILVIGTLVYFSLQSSDETKSKLTDLSSTSPVDSVSPPSLDLLSPGGSLSEGSIFSRFNQDAVLAAEIVPQEFKPVWDLLDKVGVLKKAGLDKDPSSLKKKMLEEALKKQELSEEQQADVREVIDQLFNTQRVGFAFSGGTFQMQGAEMPKFFSTVSYNDESSIDKLEEKINSRLLNGENSKTFDQVKVSKSSDNPRSYEIEVSDEKSKEAVKAGLLLSGKNAVLSFGTSDPSEIIASNKGASLSQTENWNSVSKALSNASPLTFYISPQPLFKLIKEYAEQNEGDPNNSLQKQLDAADYQLAMLKESEAVLLSASFSGGVSQKSCSKVLPDSKTYSTWTQFIQTRAAEAASNKDWVNSAVIDQTLLAVRLPLASLAPYIGSIKEAMAKSSLSQSSSTNSEDFSKVNSVIDSAVSFLEQTKFTDVGILVNANPMAPIPEIAVIFANAADNTDKLFDVFSQEFNKLVKTANIPGAEASVAANAAGEKRLNINGVGPMPLTGVRIGNSSLAIGMNEVFLLSLGDRLKNDKGFPGSLKGANNNIKQAIKTGDYFHMINLDGVYQSVKPFLGMMNAGPQQNPNQPSPQEIEKLVSTLGPKIIGTQVTRDQGDRTVCTEIWFGSVS